jgi:hypothetical protein
MGSLVVQNKLVKNYGFACPKQACQKLWVRLSETSLSKIMGSLVRNKLVKNYGLACPKQACQKLWVLSETSLSKIMGSLVRNKLVNIGIEFVVFTTNCICGFYHH